MPRIPRALVVGGVFHILNRANRKARIFHERDDYGAFVDLMLQSAERSKVELYAFCLMPNHFHLVAHFESSPQMSRFMQWWQVTYAHRYNRHFALIGHLWQGRYKSLPIQEDEHLLTVLRYVVRNPVRAGLVQRAAEWPWSNLRFARDMAPWPVTPPTDQESWISEGESPFETEEVRRCIEMDRPYGSDEWVEALAARGPVAGGNAIGRPPKPETTQASAMALSEPQELKKASR